MRASPILLITLFASLLLAPARLAADLVWDAQTGWRIEGGLLTGLSDDEARTVLDLMNKARAAEEAGSSRAAIKKYDKITKQYPNSIYAPEALYRIGKIREKKKQFYKAFMAYQEMVSKYPSSEKFMQVIGEQYRIANNLLEGQRNYILWGLIPGLADKEKAIAYFELIIANAPYSDYAPLALMNVARGHRQLGNTEDALDALDRMINFYPQSLLVPDAYLKVAETYASLVDGAYYDQASTKEAITYFEDFLILFPGDTGAGAAEKGRADMKKVLAESKMKIGDFYYHKRANYKAARVFYNEAITVYPDSEVAKAAKAKLAEIDAKEQKQPAASPPPEKKKRFFFF